MSAQAYSKKTASDASFYSGFARGCIASLEGLLLFASQKPLRKLVSQSLKPLRKAQAVYLAIIILIILVLREPTDDPRKLLGTFMRWGRIVTIVVTMILDRALKENAKIFFAALKIRNPQYGAALEAMVPPKRSARDKIRKFKRIAKMGAIRGVAAFFKFTFPSSTLVVVPLVKYISVRPVLGNVFAAVMAGIHVLQDTVLADATWDDSLAALGEALVDAEDLAEDGTREFYRRLETEQDRKYFLKRFRGYLTGCGFCNSLLMQIPFLGIPVAMISECAAAVIVVDIVERNLTKENRRPFPCEDVLKQSNLSVSSSNELKTD